MPKCSSVSKHKLKLLLFLWVALLTTTTHAQSHELRFGIQKGANKILIGEGFNETKIGHSSALKIEFVLPGKSSGFSFEPSVSVFKISTTPKFKTMLRLRIRNAQLGLC